MTGPESEHLIAGQVMELQIALLDICEPSVDGVSPLRACSTFLVDANGECLV